MISHGFVGIFLLCIFWMKTEGELLMAVWVVRHGAREPNFPHNEIIKDQKNVFKGHRILTKVGMRQQYTIGRIFKDKYQNSFEITPASILVRSTTYTRTITSSLSFLSGIINKENKPFPLSVIEKIKLVGHEYLLE